MQLQRVLPVDRPRHFVGTYITAATWQKRMRAVPGPDATERWGVPVEPAGGVPQDLTPTALLRK